MASIRTGFSYPLYRQSAHLQTLSEHEAIRSPQECLEAITGLMGSMELQMLGPRLERFERNALAPQRSFPRLLRYLKSVRDTGPVFHLWMSNPGTLERIFGLFEGSDPCIDWLLKDPALLDDPSLFGAESGHGLGVESWQGERCELEIASEGSLDDSAAIEMLRSYYRRTLLKNLLARSAKQLGPGEFRAATTELAEVILRSVCDRIQREHSFSEVRVSFIGLRTFARRLLTPDSPWSVLAIYEEVKVQDRDATRATHQQAADRLLERLCEWVDRITDGTVALCWPLEIESMACFSKRISHWRSWLDALPWHATGVHGPVLLEARHVAGSEALSARFLEESNAWSVSPLRTQVDLEHLSGYFSDALRAYRRAIEGDFQGPQERSAEAIEAILSIQEVKRLEDSLRRGGAVQEMLDRGSTDSFDSRLSAVSQFWVSGQAQDEGDLQGQGEAFCASAQEWFEGTVGVPVLDSVLAETILTANPRRYSRELQTKFSGFDSPDNAIGMFQELAGEDIGVLSSRNSRYHFSKIADRLLEGILKTPSPDLTLRNIVSIGRSLGGKGVLWELFNSHALLMELYTRLCGTSPYLVQILLSNPGMIDDLFDSLMLERIPDYAGFKTALDSLCKAASDVESVVLSFRNAMHLAIGVRDILGRENITEIHRALADVHEICLDRLSKEAYRAVADKQSESLRSELLSVDYAIMLIGKLASREPNYHSDISMLVLYDSTSYHHGVFFQQVAQKLLQMANRVNRFGRLFELNGWQFLSGKSTGLSWRIDPLLESIQLPEVPIEDRMNLYTARVVGNSPLATKAEAAIERFLHQQEWSSLQSCKLVDWRRGLETTAMPENIKRGWGGTLDVEVLTHIFYAKHLHTPKHPWLRGTIERLEALRKNGVLSPEVALQLRDAYYFLRGVESGLRLMNTKLRHDLPREELELSKLAYVLQTPDRDQLLESCEHYRKTIDDLAQRYYAQFRAQCIGESS